MADNDMRTEVALGLLINIVVTIVALVKQAVVVLILLGVLDAAYIAFRYLRSRHQPASVARPVRFDAPQGAELELFLIHEEFHPFQHRANILEMKIRAHNLTNKTKHLMSFQPVPDPPVDGQDQAYAHAIEVSRELHAYKGRRAPELHSMVGPNDTAEGWFHMVLPHQPWGGVGGYSLVIDDEVGTKYVLRREARGSRKPAGTAHVARLGPLPVRFEPLTIRPATLEDAPVDVYRLEVALEPSDDRPAVTVCATMTFELPSGFESHRGLWTTSMAPPPECQEMRRDGLAHGLDVLMTFGKEPGRQEIRYWSFANQGGRFVPRGRFDFKLELSSEGYDLHVSRWAVDPQDAGRWTIEQQFEDDSGE